MARRRIVEGATGLLRAAMACAVTNLDKLANDENTQRPPGLRRPAESSSSLRAHELEDLEQHITMLEQTKGNENER